MMATMEDYRAIDGNDLVAPVEVREVFEEAFEHFKGCVELVMKVVEEKGDEHVKSVRGHVRCVRAKQRSIKRQPALEQQD